MIISASRRTDIPAFYTEWFFNRIKEGYVLVRNPMNYHQVSRVSLSPAVVDGIVFWTKNPAPMMPRLGELKEYPYYFQFTLTPYGKEMEPGLPSKKEVLIPAFCELSRRIGPERVIWRYDPILISPRYTVEKHIHYFEIMAGMLQGYTRKCIISFVDMYKNTVRNQKKLGIRPLESQELDAIAQAFSETAKKSGMILRTCGEEADLSDYGILHGACIDRKLLEQLAGCSLQLKKDKNQRRACACSESIDIGAYHTCKNFCQYCYANYNVRTVEQNYRKHNSDSALLVGVAEKEERITERKVKSCREEQMWLFGRSEAEMTK